MWGLGTRVWGVGLGCWGLGLGAWGLGIWVRGVGYDFTNISLTVQEGGDDREAFVAGFGMPLEPGLPCAPNTSPTRLAHPHFAHPTRHLLHTLTALTLRTQHITYCAPSISLHEIESEGGDDREAFVTGFGMPLEPGSPSHPSYFI